MLILLFNCYFYQLCFPVFTPQLLNKLRRAGPELLARNRFYLGKLVLVAGWEDFSAGSVFLAGWLMSCAIFLLPWICFSRRQTLGCGTDIQQHQARGAGIPEWVFRGAAGCPNNWEKFCLLLMVSGFLGEAGLPRARDSEKHLRICLCLSLFSKSLDWNGLLKPPASHWHCIVSA